MFTRDGGVVPFGIPVGAQPTVADRRRRFGLCRGFVQRAVFPDDADNKTGGLEYIVLINKVLYHGVIDVTQGGGTRNNHVRVRAGRKFPKPGLNVPEHQEDGDHVWCLFVNGDADIPIIIGGAQHERVDENYDFKKPSKSDGEFERYEYNGIEILTDKDGSYSISIVGNKLPLPGLPPSNPTAIGTMLKINKDGKIEVVARGTGEIFVSTDTGDIKAETLSGNVSISTLAGNVSALATVGDILLEASQAKLKLGKGMVGLGGPAGELVDLFDKNLEQLATLIQAMQTETHVGNLGYPTSPPVNAAAYAAVHTQILALRLLVGLIKGGI